MYHATVTTDEGDLSLALKEPQMSGTLHTETVERMLEEAETWQQLDDHDHIVSVVDYGAEPLPWIAMEYMDAGHLGDCAGELDVKQALWTAIATTKAVRHAHTYEVAHLDLKPSNILFRSVADARDVPECFLSRPTESASYAARVTMQMNSSKRHHHRRGPPRRGVAIVFTFQ